MPLPTPTATTPYGARFLQASFRGAAFAVEEDAGAVGRRGRTHEYPFRDTPYDEDLGRRARRYAFKAFVIGDDADAQRDALIAAIEAKGPGQLVHPSLGRIQVAVDKNQPCAYRERWDNLRVIEFDLAFVEPGQDLYPTSALNTQTGSDTAASGIGQAADQDLADGTANPNAAQAQAIGQSDANAPLPSNDTSPGSPTSNAASAGLPSNDTMLDAGSPLIAPNNSAFAGFGADLSVVV